ncbi:MAG: hypothetical protein CHACPFDD_00291 [Phycisphaerae bacterium]|nr:hypothetical protein [Phycisphaerae bacterium]
MTFLHDLARWFWKLLPANPILVRVVSAGGKRKRHLAVRTAYLGILFVFLVLSQTIGEPGTPSLAALAKHSSRVFMQVSFVQLALMCLIAPVFTAGAITQEKDSNTFNILLSTPLSDGQIVLGTLLSRLYFVWMLLLSGLPIFCITMIYGGVTMPEVFESFGLAATTAFITGSLAIAISMMKVGTQRTIFSFFLGIALYLLVVGALARAPVTWIAEAKVGTTLNVKMSWLAPFHPFLSLLVVTGQTPAPSYAEVQHYTWPWPWLLSSPHYAYMLATTLGSIALIIGSHFNVRRTASQSDSSLVQRVLARFTHAPIGEVRRKPRRVWNNPIAWREAATRGSAAGRSRLRWAFLVVAVAAAFGLLIAFETGWQSWSTTQIRAALTALVWIELAIILLVVTNTAASTLTRERDAGTIDLLLATPLTSKYIGAGMLRGLVSFVIPLIAAPTLTVALFFVADALRAASGRIPPGEAAAVAAAGANAVPSRWVTTPEAVVLTPLLIVAFAAAAAMIGLSRSLNSKKTTQAVMTATGLVLMASVVLWGCVMAIIPAGSEIAAIFVPFSPFPSLHALIDYQSACGAASGSPGEALRARTLRAFMSLISAGVYAGIVAAMYNHLVRGFDMTIRRQSA